MDKRDDIIGRIKAHYDLLEYAQSIGLHFHLVGQEFQCMEMDSLFINPQKQLFVRHSVGVGGSIIDFVMYTEKLSQKEAISKLSQSMGQFAVWKRDDREYANFKEITKSKDLILPPKENGQYKRVFAYLCKTRGISTAVVSEMIGQKMLYEDKEHHNCVFVGYDEQKIPRYVAIRSTGQKRICMEAIGSNKEYGWFVNYHKPALFICESPIDAMSLMSMFQMAGMDFRNYSYLSLGGNVSFSLERFHNGETKPTIMKRLEQAPEVKAIYMCYDNDKTGQRYREETKKLLQGIGFTGKVVDKIPVSKDFNQDLQKHQESTLQKKIEEQEKMVCITVS